MPEIAPNADQEFWRPPAAAGSAALAANRVVTDMAADFSGSTSVDLHVDANDTCRGCSAEFVPGALYCHACGASRSKMAVNWMQYLEFRTIQSWVGLPTASLIAFLIGVLCGLAALGVGLFHSNPTPPEWQALQLWRIEWLLAAGVSFLAGCLLKRE